MKRLLILAAVLLLLCLAPFPYGYFTFTRIVITLIGVSCAYSIYAEREKMSYRVIFYALVAILFNPIFPVPLTRPIWLVLDVIIAILFLIDAFRNGARQSDK